MSELNDVSGGETIAAAFTNQVKERSSMRYASQAALDTSVPAPVAGTVAYLQDVAVIQYYNGASWIPLVTDADVIAKYLALDGGNGPILGPLAFLGNVTVQANAPTVRLVSPDAGTGWTVGSTTVNGSNGTLEFKASDGTPIAQLEIGGKFSMLRPVTEGARNVFQSTSAPVAEGIDGDMWLQHEA